jgi:hypothetical protein
MPDAEMIATHPRISLRSIRATITLLSLRSQQGPPLP